MQWLGDDTKMTCDLHYAYESGARTQCVLYHYLQTPDRDLSQPQKLTHTPVPQSLPQGKTLGV